MILLDLDKRITIFAPGRVGSTSLSETIHPLTTNSHMTLRQSDSHTHFLTPIISQKPIPPNYYNMLESFMNMKMSIVNVYKFIKKVFPKDFDKHYVIIRDPIDRFVSGCEMLLQFHGEDAFLQFYNDMTRDKFVNLIEFCTSHPYADFHIQPYIGFVDQPVDFVHIDQVSTLIKDLYNVDMLHIDPSADWLTDKHKNKFRSFAKEHKDVFIHHIIKEIEVYKTLDK